MKKCHKEVTIVERNFFDELMTAVKGEGVDLTTAVGTVTVEIARINVAVSELIKLLVNKGVVSKDDRDELNDNIRQSLREMLKAAAEKHPEFAEEYEKYEKENP
jgi:polyhydroxyalkanoate synthesis regulator phasin